MANSAFAAREHFNILEAAARYHHRKRHYVLLDERARERRHARDYKVVRIELTVEQPAHSARYHIAYRGQTYELIELDDKEMIDVDDRIAVITEP